MKTITDKPLPRWWNDVRERYQPEEILHFLQKNRHILEKRITGLDNNSYLYRWVHRLFSLVSGLAGIVDRVVPERPDAADEPTEFCLRLGRVLGEELAGLLGRDDTERFRTRLHRYRHLGS